MYTRISKWTNMNIFRYFFNRTKDIFKVEKYMATPKYKITYFKLTPKFSLLKEVNKLRKTIMK